MDVAAGDDDGVRVVRLGVEQAGQVGVVGVRLVPVDGLAEVVEGAVLAFGDGFGDLDGGGEEVGEVATVVTDGGDLEDVHHGSKVRQRHPSCQVWRRTRAIPRLS